MDYNFKREQLAEGVYFSSVSDEKFKHNRIAFTFIMPLSKEYASDNAVVPFILKRGSRSCPDFTALSRRLGMLYGASLDSDVVKFGEYQLLNVSIYGIDDRYCIDGTKMVEECADLLCDIVGNPNINCGSFDPKVTELEKQYVIDMIDAEINDKRSYAINRCRDIMCAGESVAIKKLGEREDALRITAKSAAQAYERVMRLAGIEIMFTGTGSPQAAKQAFKKALSGIERDVKIHEPAKLKISADSVKNQTDELDVSQAKLVLGFRAGDTFDPRSLMAARFMVALYGGTPFSKLFLNVREKLSLCYYCAARFMRDSSIMLVDCGIEEENKEKAQAEILHQLEMVSQGDFTDEDITNTRLAMRTGFQAVGDSLGGLESWYMTQIMSGTQLSPSDEMALLDTITRQDIIDAAKRVSLDTVYFLKGREAAQ